MRALGGREGGALNNSVVEKLCVQLRRRASRLRLGAFFTLVLIVISLAGGISIFLYAGQISAKESDLAAREVNKLSAALDDRLSESYYRIRELSKELQSGSSKELSSNIERQLSTIQNSIKSTSSFIQELPTQVAKNQVGVDTMSMASAIITRIGSALLLIFLVQILVTLYRYNTRLASYYDARADALELVGDGDENVLEQISNIFSPESLDYGKTPVSPAQHAVDLAKEIISKGNNKNAT